MTLPTLTITAADIDEAGAYIGKEDVSDWRGHIEIQVSVRFPKGVSAKGHIHSTAGGAITAGWSITAGGFIKADGAIKAGGFITAGWDITAGEAIKAGWSITAGEAIEAGWDITAGEAIDAGGFITAGEAIEAGWDITAGLHISSKWISAGFHIFAGLCAWKIPTADEMQIRAHVRSGHVAFGTVVPPQEEASK